MPPETTVPETTTTVALDVAGVAAVQVDAVLASPGAALVVSVIVFALLFGVWLRVVGR